MFALLFSLGLLAWELAQAVPLLWVAPGADCLVSTDTLQTYVSITGVSFVILA